MRVNNNKMNPDWLYPVGVLTDVIKGIDAGIKSDGEDRKSYVYIDSLPVKMAIDTDGDGLLETLKKEDDFAVLIETTNKGEVWDGGSLWALEVEASILIFSEAGSYSTSLKYADAIVDALYIYGFDVVEIGQREDVNVDGVSSGLQYTSITLFNGYYNGYKWRKF